MKKLMIAAAIAAMIGAVKAEEASTCVDGPGSDNPTCSKQTLVYQWQFKGRTGVGVLVNVQKQVTSAGGTCVDGGVTPGYAEVIRVPGKLALVGYSYLCDSECFNLDADLMNPTKNQFYMAAPLKTIVANYRNNGADKNFITDVDVAHVIGKSASQYELAGTATFDFTSDATAQKYTLRFAGYGSYDKKNKRVSSVSGNFAGTQNVPRYPKSIGSGDNTQRCPPAGYWDCCTLLYASDSEQDDGVAYVTWSMKYNKAASAKLSKNKSGYWVK